MIIKRNISMYLGITFLISWTCWFFVAFLTHFAGIQLFSLVALPIYSLGAAAPLIGAWITKKRTTSKEEFQSFKRNIFNFKQPVTGYILVLGLAWGFCFLPVFLGASEKNAPFYVALQHFPLMIFFGGGLEEVGWRGYLQPLLQKKYSSFISTCMVSIIWVFWHLPLWLVKGSGQDTMSIVGFTIWVFSVAFLLSSIWNKYKSISLCILLHAGFNSFSDVYIPNFDNLFSGGIILLICFIFYLLTHFFLTKKT